MSNVTYVSDGTSVGDVVAAINQAHTDGELTFIAATLATPTQTARLVGGEAATNHIIAPQLLLLLDLCDQAREGEMSDDAV